VTDYYDSGCKTPVKLRKSGSYKRWACWHPSFGFLTFGSYRQARTHDYPDPRGCFSKKKDAEKRTKEDFYVGDDCCPHSGNGIQVLEITLDWTVDAATE